MKAIINFLRKIGILHVSKGDYRSGEFDSGPENDTEETVNENEGEEGKY